MNRSAQNFKTIKVLKVSFFSPQVVKWQDRPSPGLDVSCEAFNWPGTTNHWFLQHFNCQLPRRYVLAAPFSTTL